MAQMPEPMFSEPTRPVVKRGPGATGHRSAFRAFAQAVVWGFVLVGSFGIAGWLCGFFVACFRLALHQARY